MPANLQGIWAEGIQTPWNGDYHLDINVQMNYWPAEVTGLGDCHLPLLQTHRVAAEPGAQDRQGLLRRRRLGGPRHHRIPGASPRPANSAGWGATASGAAWLCEHLWEHYAFNRDKEFLAWAYPIMKGSAQFFLDMLVDESEAPAGS